MSDRIFITAPGEGVAVGGRWDGWRMRQNGNGQWVSVAKLEAVDPFAHAEGLLGTLFAEYRAKVSAISAIRAEAPTRTYEDGVRDAAAHLNKVAESARRNNGWTEYPAIADGLALSVLTLIQEGK